MGNREQMRGRGEVPSHLKFFILKLILLKEGGQEKINEVLKVGMRKGWSKMVRVCMWTQ